MDEIVEQLYNLNQAELRQVAVEALLISDGPDGVYPTKSELAEQPREDQLMKFVMRVDLELPADEEGLTDEGWQIYTDLQNAIDKLKYDYGYKEIDRVRMPMRADRVEKIGYGE
jgi:hypothetical protein